MRSWRTKSVKRHQPFTQVSHPQKGLFTHYFYIQKGCNNPPPPQTTIIDISTLNMYHTYQKSPPALLKDLGRTFTPISLSVGQKRRELSNKERKLYCETYFVMYIANFIR